jgi:unsaturated chondroitin disaccharide hydrolase
MNLHEYLHKSVTMMSFDNPYAVQCALKTLCTNLETFGHLYPDDTTTGNSYPLRRAQNGFAEGANYGWTTGFWPGVLWLAYELSGDEVYLRGAERHVQSFVNRIEAKIDIDTHDLGFLYTLTCVAAWRLTGHTQSRQAALQAAELLMTRYHPKAGISAGIPSSTAS